MTELEQKALYQALAVFEVAKGKQEKEALRAIYELPFVNDNETVWGGFLGKNLGFAVVTTNSRFVLLYNDQGVIDSIENNEVDVYHFAGEDFHDEEDLSKFSHYMTIPEKV